MPLHTEALLSEWSCQVPHCGDRLAPPSSTILGCLWGPCSFCQRSSLYKPWVHQHSLFWGRAVHESFCYYTSFFRAMFHKKAVYAKWPPNVKGARAPKLEGDESRLSVNELNAIRGGSRMVRCLHLSTPGPPAYSPIEMNLLEKRLCG